MTFLSLFSRTCYSQAQHKIHPASNLALKSWLLHLDFNKVQNQNEFLHMYMAERRKVICLTFHMVISILALHLPKAQ